MNHSNFQLSRRHFIKLTSSAGLAMLLKSRFSLGDNSTNPFRRLVWLEMNGGVDGLSTVIPYGIGTYYDLRPKLAIPEAAVHVINNQLGFHPELKQLHTRFKQGQVAVLQGVGHVAPDLSHFAMMDYWRSGHPNGAAGTMQTGWLGRVLDALNPPQDLLSGISLANGVGPVLTTQSATIATLLDTEQPYIPDQYQSVFWPLMQGLAANHVGDSTLLSKAKKGMRNSYLALDLLPHLAVGNIGYADNETSRLLDLAARLLTTSAEIRAIHVPLPLDFDTHSGQAAALNRHFSELDDALNRFLEDLTARNLIDQTLIVMASEFGRRVDENQSEGTDHGTANNAFVIGAKVRGGLYGRQPSLTNLDTDGNLKMGMSYLDLLASIAENWMGVNAGLVLPAAQPLDLFT